MAKTVRIKDETQQALRDLAEKAGESMQDTLDKAIEAYRRHQMLQETNEAYRRLRKDSKAWKQELKERKEWEGTLRDDLDE